MKKWLIIDQSNNKVPQSPEAILKTLLANRGLMSPKEINDFTDPPFPSKLTENEVGIEKEQINKAVKRIKEAIKNEEKIIVYGDYDSDGVCATAILWSTLYSLGAKVIPFIPQRDEGYGLKTEKIEGLHKEGVTLIITVDHGIVASQQVEMAKEIGVDVIITDHHLSGEKIPPALAVVHSLKLSGAGVSWFLANKFQDPGLELVTIGTVCDMMPLIGPNRSIVKYGLDSLRQTKKKGLTSLFNIAGIQQEKIGTYEIGFLIGPRLNAAGRMKDPMQALRLLCTNNEVKAMEYAAEIDQQNKERQLLTTQMTLHARDLWLKDPKGKLIFVSHETYEEGIVGLVAGKLTEEFYRPSIVVSKGEEYCRASARSISGFNIVEAIRTCSDILGPHGGHALAAGFTIETGKLEIIKERLIQLAEESIKEEQLSPVLKIDLELPFSQLNLELLRSIENFEPFGFGNPEPVFVTLGFTVLETRFVGSEGKHLKLRLADPDSGLIFDAIGFGLTKSFPELGRQDKIDVAYNLIMDNWNNNQKVQLRIKDMQKRNG
ncbi:MAG: single-stranded-DNA-specific exonuclease RecJ [bacterium]|nr:single-stranded-DNA-specific exonuclease RecJ [bacterium]